MFVFYRLRPGAAALCVRSASMLWKELNWRVAVWAWLLVMAFDALMIRLDSVASFAVFILWLLINLPGLPLVPAVVLISPNFTPLWNTVYTLIAISVLSATVWSLLCGYVFRHKVAI